MSPTHQVAYVNPFLSVSLPKAWAKANPTMLKAFKTNQHRMVTMYDLYATVRHLATAGAKVDKPAYQRYKSLPNMPLPKARTLFEEIEQARTCASVSTLNDCICNPGSTDWKYAYKKGSGWGLK